MDGFTIVHDQSVVGLSQKDDPYHPYLLYLRFSEGLNIVSYSGSHGFVRTCENKLYSFGRNTYGQCGVPPLTEPVNALFAVELEQIATVSKIVCGPTYTLIIMDSGKVWACGLYHGNGPLHGNYQFTEETFNQVELPAGEQVIDIVIGSAFVFYITASGLCYYTRPCMVQRFNHPYCEEKCLNPKSLDFLSDFVENVFVLDGAIVFQYGNSQLCLVHLDHDELNGKIIDHQYFTKEIEPIELTFFNNTTVTQVKQLGPHIYFVTDTGLVFYLEYSRNMDGTQIEEIAFFRNSPVMSNRGSHSVIRSAGSDRRQY